MKKHYVTPVLRGETFQTDEYIAACYACIDMGGSNSDTTISKVYLDADRDGFLDSNETTEISWKVQNDCGTHGSGGKLAHYITDTQLAGLDYVIIVKKDGSTMSAVKITQRMSDKDSYGGSYPHFCDLKSNAS